MMPTNLDSLWLYGWIAVVVVGYAASKRLYGRFKRWWLMPVLAAPLPAAGLAWWLHTEAATFSKATFPLVFFLGPVTAAFAVPIYEQRALIRRYWPVLLIGMVVGSATALVTAYAMASLLDLPTTLRLSLMPRSLTMPFALSLSTSLGGVPALTAVFVVFTGVFGMAIGDILLARLPSATPLVRGAVLGMAAHAIGTAKAYQRDPEEGAIAGLVMVMAGVLNVLVAPLVVWLAAG